MIMAMTQIMMMVVKVIAIIKNLSGRYGTLAMMYAVIFSDIRSHSATLLIVVAYTNHPGSGYM